MIDFMKYFGKEWYNGQCKSGMEQYEYLDYEKSTLPKWYTDFSFHDSKIIKIKSFDNLMVLDLISDDYKKTKYKIKFYNPKVIEECNLTNAWCISNELYFNDNSCEFHLMADVWSDIDDRFSHEYFTVKCSNIELLYGNKSYKIFEDK